MTNRFPVFTVPFTESPRHCLETMPIPEDVRPLSNGAFVNIYNYRLGPIFYREFAFSDQDGVESTCVFVIGLSEEKIEEALRHQELVNAGKAPRFLLQ
jgi:hypothetical protein